MWVYQETKTNAAALVPALPEDTAGESLAEKEAMMLVSGRLTEMPPQKAPRRKPFQASRDCILLAAAYLFGTLMAGVLQALCDSEEMETLAYYLDCWRGVFAASSAVVLSRRKRRAAAVFRPTAQAAYLGADVFSAWWGRWRGVSAAHPLSLGLLFRQWGRCPSFCLRCYTGQAPACSRRSF